MSERKRVYHERLEVLEREQRGDPIRFELPELVRGKIGMWIVERLCPDFSAQKNVIARMCVAIGQPTLNEGDSPRHNHTKESIREFVRLAPDPQVWSIVELAAQHGLEHAVPVGRPLLHGDDPVSERFAAIRDFNTMLGDEYIGFELRVSMFSRTAQAEIRRIDSKLLHREVVDRTFHLTAHADFASANADYAEAWKHYSKSDFDDAISNGAKALESTMKILLRKLDPEANVDQTVAKLSRALFDAQVLPSTLETSLKQLQTLCAQTIGPVRNQPGTAHGSADLRDPEAALALLVLNLTGSLIVFLIQAYARR